MVDEYDREWANYERDKVGRMINLAIEIEEGQLLNRIRTKGNGESWEWYKFVKDNKGNHLKSTNSIKVDGKLVRDRVGTKNPTHKTRKKPTLKMSKKPSQRGFYWVF